MCSSWAGGPGKAFSPFPTSHSTTTEVVAWVTRLEELSSLKGLGIHINSCPNTPVLGYGCGALCDLGYGCGALRAPGIA